VTDPGVFYAQSDRWQVPNDPTQDTTEAQPPYYILAQRPGDPSATFQLTSALNAYNRDNLSAFISASSNPATFGQIDILQLPGNTPFRGPRQVQQSFITNASVSRDLTLFNGANSKAVFGNLLTLPIGNNGLLYVEPLYVQGTGQNSFPLLRKVLVDYGDQVGYSDTLAGALNQVFGAGAGSAASDSGSSPAGGGSPTTSPTTSPAPSSSPPPGGSSPANPALEKAVADLNAALAALSAAQKSGDFAGIGQAEANLQKAIREFQAAQASASSSASSSAAKPSAARTSGAAASPSR
jgi:uncharacterized membrane protein (UPF0182 family)